MPGDVVPRSPDTTPLHEAPGAGTTGPVPVLDRIEGALAAGIRVALSLVLALMAMVVTYQVFSRFHTAIPFWGGTEEIARGLFIWLVMLGASLGVRSHSHFVVDVLPRATPAWVVAAFKSTATFVVLLVGLVLVFHGWEFAVSGLKRRSLITHLPAIWSYSAILAGAVLIALFALGDLLRALAARRRGPPEAV